MIRSAATLAILWAALSLGSCADEQPDAPAVQPVNQTDRSVRPGCQLNFERFDADEDSAISREEFLDQPHAFEAPGEIFKRRDHDGNGRLTLKEFCSPWGRPGWHRGRGRGRGMRHGPMHGMRGTGRMCERHFEVFDTDDDEKVSREEFLAWPHPRRNAEEVFAARDDDESGSLTQAEFCSGW